MKNIQKMCSCQYLIVFSFLLFTLAGCKKTQLDQTVTPGSGSETPVSVAGRLGTNDCGDIVIEGARTALVPTTYDQGTTNSCQGQAAAWLLSYEERRAYWPSFNFLVKPEMKRSGGYISKRMITSTSGCYNYDFTNIDAIFGALRNCGSPGDHQYTQAEFASGAAPEAGDIAWANIRRAATTVKFGTVNGAPDYRTRTSGTPIFNAIQNNHPVMLYIWVEPNATKISLSHNVPRAGGGGCGTFYYNNVWNTYDGTGYPENQRNYANSHYVVIWGYNPITQVFFCKNSWGFGWGDSGDFVMTFETFRNVAGVQAGHIGSVIPYSML